MPDDPKNKDDICARLAGDPDPAGGAAESAVIMLERAIAALEEGERAVCFSSGRAALSSAVLHCIERDAHVVAMQTIQPETKALLDVYLRKFGVDVTYLPAMTIDDLEDVSGPDTRLIFLESPSSSVSAMVELSTVTEFARSRGIITLLDNTWGTPLFQNALRHGVDIVVHSAGAYLAGNPAIDTGAVIGKAELMEQIATYERATLGTQMDAHQARLVLRGLRTLPIRVRHQQESSLRVARFLETHPAVSRVLHPGLPSHPQYDVGRRQMSGTAGLLSFVPAWSLTHAPDFLAEMGDRRGDSVVSLVDTGLDDEASHETGLPYSVFRIWVGLESAETLMDALDRALRRYET